MGWHWGILASSGGAAGAFDLLETTVLSSTASSVTFSNLNNYSGYKHLQLRCVIRCTLATTGSATQLIRFNGINTSDSGSYHRLYGDGSSVASQGFADRTYAGITRVNYANEGTNIFTPSVIDVLDFNNTSKFKTIKILGGFKGGTTNYIELSSGLFRRTDAITSFEISGADMAANSRFSLYGVK